MKKRLVSVKTLLSGALVLLGFSACSKDEVDETPVAYGSPSVDYRVIGEVSDEEGNPLEGIRVIVEKYPSMADTVYTDAKGAFQTENINSVGFYIHDVAFDDVDGEAGGGEFESVKVPIEDFERKKIKEGEGWYNGEYELSTKVQMKKKDEAGQ
jgi:putative lipoprotein (rSAM/lipoprotein system)